MDYSQDPFIAEILNDPFDDGPRLIYADWLEEQGDPRNEFLRNEVTAAGLGVDHPDREQLDRELAAMLRGLDRGWVEAVGKRYDVVLLSFGSQKINACKAVKGTCGWSLMVTKRMVELAPVKLMKSVSRAQVETFRRDLCFQQSGELPTMAMFASPCEEYSDDALERAEEVTRDYDLGLQGQLRKWRLR